MKYYVTTHNDPDTRYFIKTDGNDVYWTYDTCSFDYLSFSWVLVNDKHYGEAVEYDLLNGLIKEITEADAFMELL